MVTSAILQALKTVISSLLNILPSSPQFIQGSVTSFVSRLSPVNAIFPIQEIFTFLIFAISIVTVFLATWAINRIINLIRGAG